MAESKTALVGNLVNLSVNLDKDDVAAILMARAEEQLKKTIGEHQAAETQFQKEREELEKTFDTMQTTIATAFFAPTRDTLTTAATSIKAKRVKARVTVQGFNEKGGKNKQGVLHGQLVVTSEHPHIAWTTRLDVPWTPELRAAWNAILAKQKEIAANKDAWMLTRKRLADLPSLERRAKAAVAEQRLKGTEEGEALLQMLDGKLASSIKLLGVN